MRRYISICFLWAISIALWGQSNGGYGGDYDPANPENPKEPSVTMKYHFKVTAGKGGSANIESSAREFTAGTSVYLYASPNSGYKFKYWLQGDNIVSTSQWYYYTMPAKDVELQAVFTFEPDVPANPDVIPLAYKVTAEATKGGDVWYSSEKIKAGTSTYVSAYAYFGYKFVGWVLDDITVSKDSYYYFEMEPRNMHFKALFEYDPISPSNPDNNPYDGDTYTLVYMIDDQECRIERLAEGATITTIPTPKKNGYTFSGWKDVPTTMPNHDLIIKGEFVPNKYKMTYILDGEVLYTDSVTYGSKVIAIDVPRKDGYTFSGWKDIPETMPANDITVQGEYIVILGDVNRSGVVDIADAIGLVNYILGKSTFIINEEAADVNQDGTVNIADAISIVNNILNQN